MIIQSDSRSPANPVRKTYAHEGWTKDVHVKTERQNKAGMDKWCRKGAGLLMMSGHLQNTDHSILCISGISHFFNLAQRYLFSLNAP